MNKTIENLSSAIREIAAQEAEKHTDIVIGEIAEKNSDGTYDVFIVPDFVTPVTNIPNSSIYDFNIGEGCYIRKYNNQLQSSAIVDKIGPSEPRFGKGGEGLSSVSGNIDVGKTSELQNDGSDGVHPFIDTSALLQTNPVYEPSTAEDKIFSAKAVSAGFTFLIEQVSDFAGTTVQVGINQDFTDSQKETARTNIGAASQGDIEGINNNIANCVQVNAQTFTEEQKTQARTNIGAASQTERSTAADNINTLNTTVDALEQVALTANQKALVVNEYNKQLNLFKNKKLPTTYAGVTITPIGLSSYKITGTNTASANWGFNNLADVSDLDPNKTYTLKLTVVSGTGECGIQGSTTAKQVTKTGASLSNIQIIIPGSQAFSDYVVTMMLVEGSTAADYIPYYGDIIHQAEIDNSVVKYSSSQSLTDEQKTQARKNIGALSSADLSVWSQRMAVEEDLNVLANVANGKAYISRFSPNTANTPVANTYGNVISLRNSGGELTQLAMEVQSDKVYYRASATAAGFGTWKQVDTIAQKGGNYIAYTSGLKIQWGEANIPSQIETGTVITPTIKLPIAMTTGTYKIMGICTNSNANFGYDNRQASSFTLGIRNLGSSAITTSSVYSWVVIGY